MSTMLSKFRRQVNASTVIASLALVFAMTGGAYAANHYLITNTSQIKPSVLKKIAKSFQRTGPAGAQGLPGANGTDGKNGAPGATGAQGPKGETGATGAQGSKGATGATGAQGPKGETGATGPVGAINTEGPLPSGKSETGLWNLPSTVRAENVLSISFPIPLGAGSEVTGHFIGFGEGETAECPGTVNAPKAAPGNLCVYVLGAENVSVAESSAAPRAYGAYLVVKDPSELSASALGSWAVTVP
jgi:hypothetical protein